MKSNFTQILTATVTLLAVSLPIASRVAAVEPIAEFTRIPTSDCGNGTYLNPIIYGDFPDMDVTQVGDTYYMVTTTMHLFPGATILKSNDLVNWEFCANPLTKLSDADAFSLIGDENRYSHGQWASALQYHDGQFHLLINTLDDGAYLLTAYDPEGIWSMTKLQDSFYDCGLLFDGDDIYVAYGNNEIRVSKLDNSFNKVEDCVVATGANGQGLEGCRFYHIGNYYYIYATYPAWPGRQTILRSESVWGPYEEKIVLADQTATHQGALVQDAVGEWWTLLFRDSGAIGRLPYLLPVKWENCWPIIGDNGKAINSYTKPVSNDVGSGNYLATNDPFRNYQLGLQWEWNHYADPSKWSLVERPDHLRLYTATVTDDPYKARNTLTQRAFGYHNAKDASFGTIAIDITHMADGDICGLGLFQDPLAYIGVRKNGEATSIIYHSSSLTNKTTPVNTHGSSIEGDVVYLRAIADFTIQKARFYYSVDNVNYKSFGPEFAMEYDLSVFTGNRFAIFNYATKALGGYVDVDWFTTEPSFDQAKFYGNDFSGYSDEALTVTNLTIVPNDTELVVLTGSSYSPQVIATFEDGHQEDVSAAATYASSNPQVAAWENGKIRMKSDGYTTITISYAGKVGKAVSATVNVESSPFPLIEGIFNPRIWGDGTFNAETGEVKVGQYGFAGWMYSEGIDISGYKYCVAVLHEPEQDGVSFRLFDQNDYWSDAAEVSFAPGTCIAVHDLKNLKSSQQRVMDSSHIYIAGFWGYGGNPFKVKKVYLTNSDDYTETGVGNVTLYDSEDVVDVYTLSGICLRRQVRAGVATQGLAPGIYVIGNNTIIIGE